MYSLVSLKVVVPIERLWALVALKRTIVCSWLLMWRMAHEVGHGCCMPAIETRHHSWVDSNESKLTVRVLNVGEHRC